MTTCELPMGRMASRDYILQIYDGDEEMPAAIAKAFEEIAKNNNSSATLNIYTAQVVVKVSEVGGISGWKELRAANLNDEPNQFSNWLNQAHDIVRSR